jgi:hypothetical protein
MGLKENSREAAMDVKELSGRAKRGEPIYGETDLSDYLQGVAARNSTWSQLKLSAMPWYVPLDFAVTPAHRQVQPREPQPTRSGHVQVHQ